jgi:glycyl-tRNA synthetase beta chain
VDRALNTLQDKGVLKRDRAEVKKEVMEFFKQRALNVFTEMGYKRDVINAVLAYDYDNLTEALEKIKVLEEVSKEESFGDLVALLKRVGNITKDHTDIAIDTNLFREEIEKELFDFSTDLDAKLIEDLEGKLYKEYLEKVLASKDVINKYFENVMVMDKDEAIKNNRLSQLKFLNNIFSRVADLTLIEA